MIKFCNDIIEFLNSEYNDGYDFNVEITHHMFGEATAELYVNIDKSIMLKVPANSINYLYQLYIDGKFIEERNQFSWQKELIDMIEGS